MNWEALGALAELAGAIGVIVTLLYLARQVRDGTRFNRLSERKNTTRQLSEFMDLLLLHPDLAELHDRGRTKPESLTTEELIRFRRLLRRGFWYLSAQYQQHQLGALQDEEWFESLSIIRSYVTFPGFLDWWENGKGRTTSSTNFAKLVDSEIRNAMSMSASQSHIP